MSEPAGVRPDRPDRLDWRSVSGSVIGSVHVRDKLPLQDAVDSWSDGRHAVIAVADGHGHRLHFRSDVGAALATASVLDTVRARLDDLATPARAEEVLADIGAEMVATWQDRVADHLAEHPFSEAEEAGTQASADPVRAYGTTLLACATTPAVAAFWQIGDGDSVAVFRSGEVVRPLPEDPDLDGLHTSSLCQPDPLSALRCAAVDLHEYDLVLAYLCTDGFGKPRVDADWWEQTGADLLRFGRDRGLDWVGEQLTDWLDEPAQVGGDDVTLALVARTDLDHPAGPGEAPGATDPDGPPARSAAPETVPTPVVDLSDVENDVDGAVDGDGEAAVEEDGAEDDALR